MTQKTKTDRLSEFQISLATLINKHSMENQSDTNDYILAQYLCRCLDNWNQTVEERRKFNLKIESDWT